jgi:hypothetical protein
MLISWVRKPRKRRAIVPFDWSIRAASAAPNPSLIAIKMVMAPNVAAVTFKNVPSHKPNKKPPTNDAIAAPGSEKETIAKYTKRNDAAIRTGCSCR